MSEKCYYIEYSHLRWGTVMMLTAFIINIIMIITNITLVTYVPGSVLSPLHIKSTFKLL